MANFKPLNQLRPRELDVLAEIMKNFDSFRMKDSVKDLRSVLVFSTENRRDMCNSLGISEETFNNNLSILRKHKVLGKDNRLPAFLDISPGPSYTFSVIFKID